VRKVIKLTEIQPDMTWGWIMGPGRYCNRMFPKADVPVVQMSLDRTKNPLHHYQLGQQLKELREEGVLIVSSGNIVHNLSMTIFDDNLKFDWAEAFDAKVKQWILANDHEPMIGIRKTGTRRRTGN